MLPPPAVYSSKSWQKRLSNLDKDPDYYLKLQYEKDAQTALKKKRSWGCWWLMANGKHLCYGTGTYHVSLVGIRHKSEVENWIRHLQYKGFMKYDPTGHEDFCRAIWELHYEKVGR